MKEFFGVVLAVGLIALVSIGLRYCSLESNRFFSPKERQVENQVFKESEQYTDGMVRDLENLRMQYLSSTADQKEALKATILHRFAGFNENNLTPELQNFYRSLKGY